MRPAKHARRYSRKSFASPAVFAEPLELRTLMAAGQPDPTFGDNGIRDASSGPLRGIHQIVEQPDGKLLVAGFPSASAVQPITAYRYNADGTPDASFGNNGVFSMPGPAPISSVHDIALLPNGKILLAGQTFDSEDDGAQDDDFLVVRLNANGTLDTSFAGGAGFVRTNVGGPNSYDAPASIITLPDGRFYVGGSSDGDYAVVRYNAGGAIDTSFAGDGIKLVDGSTGSIAGFVMTPDGKLVLAAADSSVQGGGSIVVRLLANGDNDTSFSGDGKQYLRGFFAQDVVAVGDKLMFVGGVASTDDSGAEGIGLLRLRRDGALDTGFGPGGVQSYFPSGGDRFRPEELVIQPDGRPLVSGMIGRFPRDGDNQTDGFVARFNVSGQIDTTFGNGGVYVMDVAEFVDFLRPIIVLGDGRIVTGGQVAFDEPVGAIANPVLVRLLGDDTGPGPTDPTIGIQNGVLVARGTAGNDTISIRRAGTDNVIVTVNATSAEFDMDQFSGGVRLEGLGGDDQITVRDSLLFPVARRVTLDGGAGNDTLTGNDGPDLLRGGDGNDSLVGAFGNDTLDGGAGTDTADGGPGSNTVQNAEVTPGAPAIRILNRILTVDGSWGQDLITIERVLSDDVIVRVNGTSRQFDMDDFDGVLLRGNAGYDELRVLQPIAAGSLVRKVTLEGGGGNDFLAGSSGADVLRGGDGDDTLDARGGNDALFGGGGNDWLVGGDGLDFNDGGDGNDYIPSADGAGGDTVIGGSGTDRGSPDPGDNVSGVETFDA